MNDCDGGGQFVRFSPFKLTFGMRCKLNPNSVAASKAKRCDDATIFKLIDLPLVSFKNSKGPSMAVKKTGQINYTAFHIGLK